MTQQKSKLDEEMEAAKQKGINAAATLKHSMDDNAPVWFFEPVKKLLLDNRFIPFMLGMGVEALGLTIQNMLGMPTSTIIDILTVGVIVVVIAWYQRRHGV